MTITSFFSHAYYTTLLFSFHQSFMVGLDHVIGNDSIS